MMGVVISYCKILLIYSVSAISVVVVLNERFKTPRRKKNPNEFQIPGIVHHAEFHAFDLLEYHKHHRIAF